MSKFKTGKWIAEHCIPDKEFISKDELYKIIEKRFDCYVFDIEDLKEELESE